jgi:hypothetical protein
MARTLRTVSVRLDLQADTEQISGCIEHADGSRRPFWSWLELMRELDAAVAEPEGAAPSEAPAPRITTVQGT